MATSWVPDLTPESPFSIANIPFGIISSEDDETRRAAVAIGDYVLDLKQLSQSNHFAQVFPMLADHPDVFHQPTLNEFASLGRLIHSQVRKVLQDLLSSESSNPAALRDDVELRSRALLHRRVVKNHLPVSIGDYTDFYAGYNHAFSVGCLFRGPENALQPNYTHLPVAYHSRSSSVFVSNTPVYRPIGQILLDPSAQKKQPTTVPAARLDIELELGAIIATGNEHGSSIKVDDAENHIFGYVLLNDWSARDIQAWEYVPLGPFNAKNFASTISPWVVLAEALEPFKTRGIENTTDLQDYLKESITENVVAIDLEVELTTLDGNSTTISKTSSSNLLWSFPQMIAHHTIGGCPLRPGDLLGSGTISGLGLDQKGSLLEMTDGGKKEVSLTGGEVRKFLLDGDTITIRGASGPTGQKVGFGECTGKIYAPRG